MLWTVLITLFISLLAWIGLITLLFKEVVLHRILLLLVSFAAGSLLGGAFLHLMMESIEEDGLRLSVFIWVLAGFVLFFVIEQFFHWHHSPKLPSHRVVSKKPFTYMILLADGLHNFIDGLAIGSSFIISVEAGLITALIVAAHEIPQELGDFGILVHGGWKKRDALVFNFFSALTIVPGGILSYLSSRSLDISSLLPFTAGTFIYIASADLIPEIKHVSSLLRSILLLAAFLTGIALVLIVKVIADN
ncbi:MAG: ZIP family metal transporter [Fibrobacter sp.]|nr:ZIP family metal transporter [Fibrobacter sp.]